MKKIIFIAICSIGITCFSSCRSTSKPCGLADASINNSTLLDQKDAC